MSETPNRSLLPILRPDSVAVIGASDTPSRIGGRPIHSMKTMGYGGRIYPVNPRRETVQGLAAYPTIRDVPEAVDCALIAVPAAIAVDAIRDCADRGVKSAVVFTSGFAEQGKDGARAQAEIARIARDSGMRIVGPNCLGVFAMDRGWYGTFTNAPDMLDLPPGPVGIVSQSGAYGSHVLLVAQKRGVGSNFWVTTGNECDVDLGEVIDFYAESPEVGIIAVYAEGVCNAGRLRQALGKARDARKPVIVMKVGKTDAGARAAASHTASLAGSDAIYDALFRQTGAYRAGTTEELVDVAYACQYGSYPKGRRISLQTISGGGGVQMADDAVRYGLDVAPLPQPVQDRLKALIPFAGTNNPVDFTAQALNEPDLMLKNIGLTIEEADYDSHIVFMTSVPATPFMKKPCADLFRTVRERWPDVPMIMSLVGGRDVVQAYERLGYPVFEDPSLAVRAMAALTRFGDVFGRTGDSAPPAAPPGMRPAPAEAVGEHEAKAILASAGIPVVRESLAATPDEAVAAAAAIGGPCALKIVSPDILHKTEIGGVLLHVEGDDAVAEDARTLLRRAAEQAPEARIDGILVSEMVAGGVETVLGAVHDPVFGPAVMFGLGGVFVEVLEDVSFRLAPFGADEAHRMIGEIRGRAMLDGVRGAPPADLDALADALARLSVFAAANAGRIESIDINPFVALPKGGVAADALIVPKQTAQ
ncbi:MAG: acetate--CoA ligase family protein [Rhodospirillaceae bacterium]|nr:acetate--CoA ligase family protein [Rhodospirillaceae bacterium]MYH35999.1 acetate--CoA ligase family protein [Rhodospirillaceae bacterium]MYK13939.1 acetate--CoA ligase family protein [Rhodospirillaceae bacterium]